MKVLHDVSLKLYSTMRLGGTARYVTEVKNKEAVQQATEWAKEQKVPLRMIGGGSNIIWKDEGYSGLIIVNKISGFEKLGEDHLSVSYRIGAGENWDKVVEKTAKLNLYGIECLSLIPGLAGATPVQNVGAYGQDISQTLVSLEAYDKVTCKFVTIFGADCSFGYRTSRFKTKDNGRFLICSIVLKLQKNPPTSLWSNSLNEYLDLHAILARDSMTIRKAIIAIRKAKLPDPAKVANNGSFFANPVITTKALERIRKDFPDMPSWDMGKGMHKLSAGWLIDTAGFKGYRDKETGMATWKNHALVLVNEHAASTTALLAFRKKILDKVQELFGLTLEQEPELLP